MSELRVGAEVMGTGGALGVVDALVIDPTTATVTHLVVQHVHLGRRVLIPAAAVTAATPATVAVALDEAGLAACEQFDEPAFNPAGDYPVTDLGYEPGAYFLEPFASPLDGWALAEHERIPKGEVTFRRGDEVFSSDFERVGHIDEFLVDPTDGHVTHVVLREGHVLRHDDDVVVPVAGARFDEGRVIVGLDMAALRDLPRIPVTRHGHIRGESA